jgi:transcriptional regulator GlxA family with amidase domain
MPTQTIALVIHEGVQALDVAGPADVFAEANRFIPAQDAYELLLVAPTPAPLRTSNGTRLLPDRTLDETRDDDHAVALVAGGPALPDADNDVALSDWLRAQASRGGVIGSICTGAFLLGRAGLLDGKRVTTHWSDAARLAAQFPLAQVEHDRIHRARRLAGHLGRRHGGHRPGAGFGGAKIMVPPSRWPWPSACWCWRSARAASRSSAHYLSAADAPNRTGADPAL